MRNTAGMGLWIKIDSNNNEPLNLTSVHRHLEDYEGVQSAEPKLLGDGQAFKLAKDFGEPPHLELSPTSLVFYIHWSDNSAGQLRTLLKSFMKDNSQICGRCYDGYFHKDHEAVQKFIEFAGLA